VRILIADDDAMSRRLLEATLVKLGHQVIAVPDGTQATSVLLSDDGPRLAILDWMMPGEDGPSVCRAIRKKSATYTYIILLTSLNAPADVVNGLESGADDFLSKPFNAGELRARLHSGVRVLELQAGLLDAQRELQWHATRDHLTGIWNRRMILEQLGRELNRASHDRAPLAVALVDLDLFKKINDTYGHAAGDLVLRATAATLRQHMRAYDYVGRYGGEEFLVLLPACDTPAGLTIVERLRAGIASTPVQASNLEVSITVSIGLSSTADVGLDSALLIAAADAALYRAKAAGRDRVAA